METTGKFNLSEEKETLFITLYAKSLDYRSKNSILNDKAADDLLNAINRDFTKYEGFGNNLTVVRAKQFDDWIQAFIKLHKDAVVVYLGCGLDTRITRIDPPASISWFDVDYPEVIRLRKTFYAERDGYQMIGSSVTETGWLSGIPRERPTLIIAEGLLEYLSREEVQTLLHQLTSNFNHGQMMFDVMNSFAINLGKQKLKDATGAVHKWAVDNPGQVDSLNPRLQRITELSVFKSKYIKQFSIKLRLLLSLITLIPQLKNMLRLMLYKF